MSRPDPEITSSRVWLKMTNTSQEIVRFYPAEDSYPPDVLNSRFLATHHEYVTGFGVRAGHSDIFEWWVYPTQDEADEAFEYLADGRIYSAEAA